MMQANFRSVTKLRNAMMKCKYWRISKFCDFNIWKRGICSQQISWNVGDMVDHILNDKVSNIVVMAGAGISTPSGIPDFRSPGSGLYDNLQQYNLPYAEAIFDINYFHMNPTPFFKLAKELYPGNYSPNYVHHFCHLLYEKGKLLRMYTQNIDGLERMVGIPKSKLVEAHGTFLTATCTLCRTSYDGFKIKDDVMNGKIPICEKSWCKSVIKPDIVFFGEQLPASFYYYLIDMSIADLLIVLGTSLEVEPFASIADSVSAETPRLLINNNLVGSFVTNRRQKDVSLLGDLVTEVRTLVQKLGWQNDMTAKKL